MDDQQDYFVLNNWQHMVTHAESRRMNAFSMFSEYFRFTGEVPRQESHGIDQSVNVCQSVVRSVSAQLWEETPRFHVEPKVMMPPIDDDDATEEMAIIVQETEQIVEGRRQQFSNPQKTGAVMDYADTKSMRRDIAKTVEILINNVVRLSNGDFDRVCKKIVQDTLTCGVGFARIDWQSGDGGTSLLSQSPMLRRTTGDYIRNTLAQKSNNGDATQETQMQMPVPDQHATNVGYVVVSRSKPMNIVIPEEIDDIENIKNAPWLAEKHMLSLQTAKQRLQGHLTQLYEQGKSDSDIFGVHGDGMFQQAATVCIWEVFDAYSNRRLVFANNGRCLIINQPYHGNKHTFFPHTCLTFSQVTDQRIGTYPLSDVQGVIGPQQAINHTMMVYERIRKQQYAKFLIDKRMATAENIEAMKSAERNGFIVVANPSEDMDPLDLSSFVVPFPHAPENPSTMSIHQHLANISLATGVTPSVIGTDDPRTTATSSIIAQKSYGALTTDKSRSLSNFLGNIAQMIAVSYNQNGSIEDVADVVGGHGKWTPEPTNPIENIVVCSVTGPSGSMFSQIVPNIMQMLPLLQNVPGIDHPNLVRSILRFMGIPEVVLEKIFDDGILPLSTIQELMHHQATSKNDMQRLIELLMQLGVPEEAIQTILAAVEQTAQAPQQPSNNQQPSPKQMGTAPGQPNTQRTGVEGNTNSPNGEIPNPNAVAGKG